MSMSTIEIYCDSCDYCVNDTFMWGRFDYAFDDYRLHVNREKGWCNDCKSFKAIEYFAIPTEEEPLWQGIDNLHKTVLPNFWRYLFLRLTGRLWLIKNDLDKIKERYYSMYLLSKRQDKVRCLACGSCEVQPFRDKSKREHESGDFSDYATKMIHPGCGGVIHCRSTGMRLHMRFDNVRVYSPEGEYLGEEKYKTV